LTDRFEDDLAALRAEVGNFVLEVLGKGQDRKIADDIAAGIAERLTQTLHLQVRLNDAGQRALTDLQAEVAEMRRVLARLPAQGGELPAGEGEAPGRQAGKQTVYSIENGPATERGVGGWGVSGKRGSGGGTASGGIEGWLERHWLWIVGALAVIIIAGAAALFLTHKLPFGRQAANPNGSDQAAESTSPQNETPRAPAEAAEANWKAVRAVVAQWPADRRDKAMKVLCGDAGPAKCPTFAERRPELAKQPEQRREAMLITLQAMKERNGCAPVGPDDPKQRLADGAVRPSSDLSEALWSCMLIEGHGE
jgi:hypothetical protein